MPDRGTAAERHGTIAWGGALVLGGLLIALGVFAIVAAFVAGVTAILVAGGLLVAAGVVEIVGAFRSTQRGGFWPTFLAGLLSTGVGVLLLTRPLAGLAATTVLIGSLFVALGLFRIVTAAASRYAHWGWDVGYGIVALVLGGYVLMSWPISAVWLVGTLVGVELVSRGIAWLGVGIALRRFQRRVHSP